MTYLRSVIFVLAVLTSSAFAEPPTDNKASEFLEVGNDYFLIFGSGDNPFSFSHTAPNSTGKTKEGIAQRREEFYAAMLPSVFLSFCRSAVFGFLTSGGTVGFLFFLVRAGLYLAFLDFFRW